MVVKVASNKYGIIYILNRMKRVRYDFELDDNKRVKKLRVFAKGWIGILQYGIVRVILLICGFKKENKGIMLRVKVDAMVYEDRSKRKTNKAIISGGIYVYGEFKSK